MAATRVCVDIEECERLWTHLRTPRCLFDLWPVRACFQQAFQRPPFFVIAEEDGEPRGVLALSRLHETGEFAFFPGETWQGKTWLEQNKIPAAGPDWFRRLLARVPAPAHIRYLDRASLPDENEAVEDEVGYLFFPG
ncbi:MAG: cellulose biosynthesis protein CelD, partial [Candidatus Hydrogenedentes bacterium]|nr:cellulose biosynthesis protein CelD [Candidatus Hydrogenedentota bacterium]